jgi:hypothetical protein
MDISLHAIKRYIQRVQVMKFREIKRILKESYENGKIVDTYTEESKTSGTIQYCERRALGNLIVVCAKEHKRKPLIITCYISNHLALKAA